MSAADGPGADRLVVRRARTSDVPAIKALVDVYTTHRGAEIPFHGEVALLPWDVEAEGEELVCRVRC